MSYVRQTRLYTHPQPAVVRQLIEALEHHQEQTRPIQKTIDALAAAKGATVMNDEDEPKPCPNCGSTDTRTVSEYAGGEVVCTADQCDECNHQWNVG